MKAALRANAAADSVLLASLAPGGYAARVERLALVEIEAFDWNCPQHIPRRFSEAEVQARVRPQEERIAELEVALRGPAAPPDRP